MGASHAKVAEQLEVLGSALACDVLDTLGFHHSFLGPEIKAMGPSRPVAGRAVTIRCAIQDQGTGNPYGVLFDALGERRDSAILVMASAERRSGLWGELLSVAARARGFTAAVTDGLTRDVAGIRELGFPVFASGTSPLDSAGRQTFAELQVPIRIGDATICPGDWLIADDLGVAVVPADHLDQVIELGMQKMAGEDVVRAELAAGGNLADVFERHGIL